ncbi:BTAD domain-containing putative transcriptional regulator [Streptomyces ossamyceticus]|nr:BTAD domain-containing putative transcriptional regulator [Streptomyces ossamyceticus]
MKSRTSTQGDAVAIHLLGPISVFTDGHPRGVGSSKVRTMLAILALETGQAVSHSDLADELWSGDTVRNPRNALQAHATRVRRVLKGESGWCGAETTVLRSVPNGYVLDVPREHIDGHRFLDLASQAATTLADAPERALRLLDTALLLWRGPALLDAGDGLRCRSAARLFEERRLSALADQMRARIMLGDHARAIAELHRLVVQFPLREHFCDLLMLALYQVGRQSDALEQFRLARQRLDEELGIRPGELLQRRHAEILAQDPALAYAGLV